MSFNSEVKIINISNLKNKNKISIMNSIEEKHTEECISIEEKHTENNISIDENSSEKNISIDEKYLEECISIEEEISIEKKTPPDYLSKKNEHERDKNITFDEGPHIYTVNGDSDYTSVTTFVHQPFSHFDSDKIIKMILKKKEWRTDPTYKYYQKTAEEIKAMWDLNGASASGAGTKMHYDIECYYNGMDVKNDSIEFKYFLDFARDYSNLEPYRTEWCVYHEELKLSGSIDMVFRDKNTNEFYIYDWKRSKEISYESYGNKTSHLPCLSHIQDCNFWHYSLQLNTYRAILEKKYGLKISGLFLVICHPDSWTGTYDRIETHDLRKEVEDLFEWRKETLLQNKI